MIAYDFVGSTMESLDALETELLVLPFFSDERPLRGAAGLVDWRLCGRLSRKLMAGYIDGAAGEKALVAAPPKLRARGLLLAGLGPSRSFGTSEARESCIAIADALAEARVSTAAVSLPGRSLGLLPALEAMQLWLSIPVDETHLEEIAVVESSEEHRSLASLLDGLRRQAESPLA